MRILEKEIDMLVEDSWYQWEDCPDAMFDSVESIAYKIMNLHDFNSMFKGLSETGRNKLLLKSTVYEHGGCVYFVDNRKFIRG